MASSTAAPPPNDQPKVDRQTTTPFLLKLFYKSGSWHRLEDFSPTTPLPTHVQIYTWPSCTLRELTHLLTSALPSLLPTPSAGTRVAFRLVYPDTRASNVDPTRPGRYLSKELGSVVIGASLENRGADDDNDSNNKSPTANGGAGALENLEGDAERTLQDARFVIGDYVSCAVLPPLADGGVAPMPSGPRGSMSGGLPPPPRSMGNGFGRGRGPRNGFAGGDFPSGSRGGGGGGGVPPGEWRRGERIPDRSYGGSGGGGGGGGYRGRGRGRGW